MNQKAKHPTEKNNQKDSYTTGSNFSQKPLPARNIAAEVLDRTNPAKAFASDILAVQISKTDEKQRATDLVMGVLRNKSAIDTVITKSINRPIARIDSRLLNIIRIGTFELIYRPATPEHAIINQAVEITKTTASKKQGGFVNACLRQIQRNIIQRTEPHTDTFTSNILPQNPDSACSFNIDILPEPDANRADYLADAFSLPLWLINSFIETYGIEKTTSICFACNRTPAIYIRANALKTTPDELADNIKYHGINCKIIEPGPMIKILTPTPINQIPGFDKGFFTVQDFAAAIPVKLMEPKPGDKILDLCAAPGTKTTQIAEFTADSAQITATDIDRKRLEMLTENITRLGTASIRAIGYSEFLSHLETLGPFDSILLDVPCSNTGVLARRPEARYRLSEKSITDLNKIQMKILENAKTMLKPAGVICYSTCSIEPMENVEIIKAFITNNPQFEVTAEELTLPDAIANHDGGYCAIIEPAASK